MEKTQKSPELLVGQPPHRSCSLLIGQRQPPSHCLFPTAYLFSESVALRPTTSADGGWRGAPSPPVSNWPTFWSIFTRWNDSRTSIWSFHLTHTLHYTSYYYSILGVGSSVGSANFLILLLHNLSVRLAHPSSCSLRNVISSRHPPPPTSWLYVQFMNEYRLRLISVDSPLSLCPLYVCADA